MDLKAIRDHAQAQGWTEVESWGDQDLQQILDAAHVGESFDAACQHVGAVIALKREGPEPTSA